MVKTKYTREKIPEVILKKIPLNLEISDEYDFIQHLLFIDDIYKSCNKNKENTLKKLQEYVLYNMTSLLLEKVIFCHEIREKMKKVLLDDFNITVKYCKVKNIKTFNSFQKEKDELWLISLKDCDIDFIIDTIKKKDKILMKYGAIIIFFQFILKRDDLILVSAYEDNKSSIYKILNYEDFNECCICLEKKKFFFNCSCSCFICIDCDKLIKKCPICNKINEKKNIINI